MTEDSAMEQSASISSPSGISQTNSKIRTKTKTNSQNTLQVAEEYQLKQLRHLQYEQAYNISRSRDNKLGLLFSNLSHIATTQIVTFEHLVKIAHGIPNLDSLKQNNIPSAKFDRETAMCSRTSCKPNEVKTTEQKNIVCEKLKENQLLSTFSDKSAKESHSTNVTENFGSKNVAAIKNEIECSPGPSCYINAISENKLYYESSTLESTLPEKIIRIKSEVDDFEFSADSEPLKRTAEPLILKINEESVTVDLNNSISNEPSIGPDSIPEIEESTNEEGTSQSSTPLKEKPQKRKIGPTKKRGRPAATEQSPNTESATKKGRKPPRKVYRRGKEKTFEEKDTEWVLPYHARVVKKTRSQADNDQYEKSADNQSQEENQEVDD
ncbi:hypothetical protein L5515_019452 [Caenorhabditis briggsae]|uniref:Uncharacterized protein n=1 Tax=Caenorhabditis briggsae TaxID=6238 RepID=A0AAE9FPH8_CAEBR|nr:hypothetical protein L5515_019452 [Caenorhabditis briggsae]